MNLRVVKGLEFVEVNEVPASIDDAERIVLHDYSNFEPGMGSDGGRYGFEITYTKTSAGWQESHSTTAEFPNCSYCGSFNADSCCNKEYNILSSSELREKMASWLSANQEGKWIEAFI